MEGLAIRADDFGRDCQDYRESGALPGHGDQT